ncbi:glycosyltransferase [Brevibacillus fluminis]|uniref:glycosyltransferase n=1 Tax=Brevibacillus fluminis TaxID=511487 RepID=UPI003F88CEAE
MRDLSVIIPAQNEAETIQQVILEAKKLEPAEIIVVLNGSTDETKTLLDSLGCITILFPQSLGNDVGRAIGAFHAKHNGLLFLDGDIPIPHDQLLPFVEAIERGMHVALNDLNWSAHLPIRPHTTTVAKVAFNWITKRLISVNSLLAIPHAMSKSAVEAIGWWNLADPVLAQALISEKKLSWTAPASVDVITRNRVRPIHMQKRPGSPFPVTTDRIMGDHLLGIQRVISQKGPRGGYADKTRNRLFLQHYQPPNKTQRQKAKRSAVIPVMEEKETIAGVIESLQLAGIDEIIVVANGADGETIQRAIHAGAIVLPFASPLGHNVGRAIGAAYSTGDICLFVDGDFVLPPKELVPFIEAVENGVDVALNDLQHLLDAFHPLDAISSLKYFLNLSLKRPDLLNNSLTAVPHAMHRRVIDTIGFDKLMIPPLAQAHAQLAGFTIKAVHGVDVIHPNRVREDHQMDDTLTSAFDRITGDHLEALHYLLQMTNSRGGFSDGERDRQIIATLRRGT